MIEIGRGEASLGTLMGISPEVAAQLVEQALGLAEAGRLAEAANQLTALGLVDAHSPMLPCLLGTVRAEQGAYGAAIAAFDEALERHVRAGGHARFEGEVRLLRARALISLGRREDAQVDLMLAAATPDAAVRRGAQALMAGLAGHSA